MGTPSSIAFDAGVGTPVRVHRVEVRVKPGRRDARAELVLRRAKDVGIRLAGARTARVYLIEGALGDAELARVVERVLADPVVELSVVGASPVEGALVEVHPLPGVMDPAAQSVREAIGALLGREVLVSTGVRYDLMGVRPFEAETLARRALANPVVHQVSANPVHPASLPRGTPYEFRLRHVPIRDLDDGALLRLSREGHLFLSLEEMRAIRDEFRTLGREPTDIELETLAQTWSEHCVHKTLKSTVRMAGAGTADPSMAQRPGHERAPDGSVTIRNLLKSTIAAATRELMDEGVSFPLSVFKDNSGVVEFDDRFAVNIKVETHNRPSAIEPYGGAATGVGGCIRDVIATGLGARPIANTDVFCVAFPDRWAEDGSVSNGRRVLPAGVLPPRRILSDVAAGVRDYGNRMGIPTVNGAVSFDDRYVGNPLVFCGCVGLIPRELVRGEVRAGDRIIALGGRTGRDGIHGATFSSAEIGQGASTEFAHAVQIGNAIEEKRLLDAILRAREAGPGGTPLFHALTDCGAGGFSSAVGEMGSSLGAFVELDRAPLKYAGLSYTEVWISEAQERIVLSVPAENVPALRAICREEGVELADLGHFGTPNAELVLNYRGHEVGRLPMGFLHEGIPMPTRDAVWPAGEGASPARRGSRGDPGMGASLRALLGHPSIASKHWLVRMYDHEVQGNTVVKPMQGPREVGPGDAAVLAPVIESSRGIAIACGLQTPIGDREIGGDPYAMALAAIDECVRNLVCVGADPDRVAILDNFCWPSCDKPQNMGALVRACHGCYDGAKAYRTPFVSGKDSLNNQLRYVDPVSGETRVIEIPCTLLITGLGIVHDVARSVTMDAKTAGNVLLLVGETQGRLGGSHLLQVEGAAGDPIPRVDLRAGPLAARFVAARIADGLVRSAHDVSDGGVLTAVAEMLIATCPRPGDADGAAVPLGAVVAIAPGDLRGLDARTLAFDESPSRYVLEVEPGEADRIIDLGRRAGVPVSRLAMLSSTGRLVWREAGLDERVADLRDAWMAPLDW